MRRFRVAQVLAGAVGTVAVAAAVAAPAQANPAEDKFVADIKNSNSIATNIPGTPERWLVAGYTSCDRITRTSSQGLPIRAAINNEVIAATTFNVIPRQDAVALVTYAVLDLCPQLIPQRATAPPPDPNAAPPAPNGALPPTP